MLIYKKEKWEGMCNFIYCTRDKMYKILIVEDDMSIHNVIEELLNTIIHLKIKIKFDIFAIITCYH